MKESNCIFIVTEWRASKRELIRISALDERISSVYIRSISIFITPP